MMRYWANFARSGNPGGIWQKWASSGDSILILDSPAGGGVRMITDRESQARIVADLEADTSVTEEQRCLVFYAMRFWAENEDTFVPSSCMPALP